MEEHSNPPAENPPPQGRAGTPPPSEPRKKFFQRPTVIIASAILVAFVCFVGGRFLIHSHTHESTDDAFIQADSAILAPRVSGQVRKLLVTDNEQVKRGELLLEIDPRDYEAVAAQKRAALQAAQTTLQTARSNLKLAASRVESARATEAQRQAEVAAAEATTRRATNDLIRYKQLLENQTISPSEFDAYRANANSNLASLQATRNQAAAAHSAVNEAEDQLSSASSDVSGAEARVKQATADLQAAELNLSYTKIYSPTDGRVTHRTVDKGDYLQVGQNLMVIVPNTVYVVANFKETQLAHMRAGQPASIEIDAYSGKKFPGHVDSIQAGSGANFSLLPPENAVGNYVKVVQRVPVKILFNDALGTNHVFGPGLSVVPSVTISNFSLPNWVLLLVAIIMGVLVAMWGLQRAATSAPQTA